MEVLRRCPLAIAQRLVHCAIALSTAVLDRVTKTMSVAPLLTNNLDNSKQKTSNLLSPAPPPYSWSLLGKSEGPAPPPSSKISWSFDLAWNPVSEDKGKALLYFTQESKTLYHGQTLILLQICVTCTVIALSYLLQRKTQTKYFFFFFNEAWMHQRSCQKQKQKHHQYQEPTVSKAKLDENKNWQQSKNAQVEVLSARGFVLFFSTKRKRITRNGTFDFSVFDRT